MPAAPHVESTRDLLREAAESLRTASTTPRLDAEILLAHVCGWSRTRLIAELSTSLTKELREVFFQLVTRRRGGEPVAYITQTKEFFGEIYYVDPSVLVPRPDTEVLVETGLQVIEDHLRISPRDDARVYRILDLGTGSGCVAIALAKQIKARQLCSFRVVAVDRSDDALRVARRNAAQLGVSGDISFFQGDWFNSLPLNEDTFDLIVSNPPYVADEDTSLSVETSFEPAAALFSGKDGLRDLRSIISAMSPWLQCSGSVCLEVGSGQREGVDALIQENLNLGGEAPRVTWVRDLAGHDRVVRIDCQGEKRSKDG